MKLACRVNGHPAMVVGYANAKRSKVWAIVIVQGELRPVRLRDIELLNVPEELSKSAQQVVPLGKSKAGSNA